MNNIKKVALKDIVRDDATQMRVAVDKEVVDRYAYDMEGGDQFPPVWLVQDGRQYYIVDGHYRIGAAEACGRTKIDATVETGSRRDAILLACSVNGQHGQQRTPEDVKKLLYTMFADQEWGAWSSRELASHTRISRYTVDKVRGQYEAEQLAAGQEPKKRKGKDGVERSLPTPKATEEVSFDTEELDEQPAAPAPRNGKPLASSKDRNDAKQALSTLIKKLNRLGIYDEFLEPLSAIAERLKQI